jgi:phosphate transport system substrate-binding protein
LSSFVATTTLVPEQDVTIRHEMTRKNATSVAGIALALLMLAACGTSAPAPTPVPLSGTYTASGGGGALPAVQALTARFKELHPDIDWVVSESGSSAAVKLVTSNTVDVGFVSRALTDAEQQTVTQIPIGFTGTAVIVNAANPLTNLTREQLRQIYSGEVKSWADLGWTEPTIRPYIREKSAATRQTFETFLFAGSPPTYGKNVVEQIESEAMFVAINSFRGSIGIASTGSRTLSDSRVKAVSIDGVAGTQENIASGSYKIVRPLALVYSKAAEMKPAIRTFLEFVKSAEGQRIAAAAF